MKYVLENPDRFDSFIFGSSRVGLIHTDKIVNENCYNMTYSAGLPGWHLLNIKTFLKNGVHPQKIYIGLDSLSYTTDYERQINEPIRCPYEYLANDKIHMMKLYLNPAMILRSMDTILDGWFEKREILDVNVFYKYGWRIGVSKGKFDWSKAKPSYGNKENINLVLEFLDETARICRENGIELILFTNPMHYITYIGSLEDKNYFKFLEGLAEISDFWNFSSLNDITLNNDNYYETSHYRAEVGDIIIDIICNGKSYPELQRQGFGVKVTRENVKDFIAMLKQQAEEYMK